MLISLIIALVLIGLVLWAISLLPLDPAIHQIIRVVAIVFVVLWLLSVLTGYSAPLAFHRGL